MELNDSPTGRYQGGIYNYFQGATIHNIVINGNMSKSGEEHYDKNEESDLQSKQNYTEIIRNTQQYFWGQASYAVLYCVMRDYFQYSGSMSQFEREVENSTYDFERNYHCPAGTLKMAFKNNKYYNLPINRWKENGALDRTMTLVDKLKESIEEL